MNGYSKRLRNDTYPTQPQPNRPIAPPSTEHGSNLFPHSHTPCALVTDNPQHSRPALSRDFSSLPLQRVSTLTTFLHTLSAQSVDQCDGKSPLLQTGSLSNVHRSLPFFYHSECHCCQLQRKRPSPYPILIECATQRTAMSARSCWALRLCYGNFI